jgi:PAS domain S-box-containing protein
LASVERAAYRRILDAVGVALYTTDPDGVITYFNDAAATFWGRRPQQGERWCGSWRLFWNDGRPMRHDECPMAVTVTEHRPVRGFDAIVELPDGSRRAFMPLPTPLFDDGGAIVGAVNVLIDISERKRAEAVLESMTHALRSADGAKDEFLGLVSHELRTPVTTIYGNARLLADGPHRIADADQLSMLNDIASEAERLYAAIENLLVLSRVNAGQAMEREPILIDHRVRATIDAFRRRHPARPIRYRTGARGVLVAGDHLALDRLLDNLLANADRFSPPGAAIEVALVVAGDDVRLQVLDRGVGIPAADAARLLDPFERGGRPGPGMGIGLTVVRRVAEAHGGRISLTHREGGGVVVTVVLPIRPSDALV